MTVDIPSSYVGTSGQLMASFFSVSAPDEWTTNISVKAKTSDGGVLGSVNISGAPFKANRATGIQRQPLRLWRHPGCQCQRGVGIATERYLVKRKPLH